MLCLPALGQEKDYSILRSDSIIQQFDSLFNSSDSLSLFRLIDSLIQMPEVKDRSQFAVRMGYNSNVVAASRTIGFNQFGLAPGISYYHKSGLYADVSGYWSKQYIPDYYLTVASAGYIKTVTTHWSLLAEYSHYFYSPSDSATYSPYTNNVGVSNFFDFKPVTFRLDYYFYFGEKSAHRLNPGIMLTLQKKKWHGFDRVSLLPAVNILMGSERVISAYVDYSDIKDRQRYNLLHPKHPKPLNYPAYENVYGIMNYSMTLPLSVTLNSWHFLASYTYNIPKSLPHEDVGLQNGGYFSFSVSKYIEFKSK